MIRNCNGGNGREARWCGKPATVIVSAFVNGPRLPLQWFACDDPEHHRYESLTHGAAVRRTVGPLADWLKANGLDP